MPAEAYCKVQITHWVASCDLESLLENNLNGDLATM